MRTCKNDTESCLRRSVLLNNTLRRLQRDARDEKCAAPASAVSVESLDCASSRLCQHNANFNAFNGGGSALCSACVGGGGGGGGLDPDADEAPRAAIKRRRSNGDVARLLG